VPALIRRESAADQLVAGGAIGSGGTAEVVALPASGSEGSTASTSAACSQMLCAVASSGTVHVWSLDAQRGAVQGGKSKKDFSLISGERAFAHAKLPAGTRAVAGLRPAAGSDDDHGDEMALLLVTENGTFYSYRVDALRGGECTLQDERRVGVYC